MESAAAEVLDAPAATGPGRPEAATGRTGRTGHETVLRVVCHLAAELPIVVFAVVELARGWRPVYDNAALSLRSWQVFGPHPPLVGHQMAISVDGRAVFAPGPLQNWILAVPVRVDPAQGALWGAVLAVVAAVAVAVEASWAVGGWPAGATTAGAVLVFALVRPELVLDTVWNVWFALLVLVTTFCTALAVATGRLRWWPVCVVAASIVVQCQAAYAPPAVGLAVVAPLVGLAVRRRRREGIGVAWWVVGLGIGVLAWAAPVVQEATTHPGNLTLLVRAAGGSGRTIGATAALRALGGATRVLPDWVHPLPGGGGLAQFVGEANIVSGPGWWGAAVIALLVVVAVAAWSARRTGLAALAVLSLVLALGAVATVASVPLSQFPVVGYLAAVLAPAGIAVWVTIVWAAAVGGAAGLRLLRGTAVPGRGEGRTVRPVDPGLRWVAGAVLVGLSAWLVVLGLGQTGGTAPTLSGWASVHDTDAATAAALRVAPRGAFGLQVGPASPTGFAVLAGVAYQLATHGVDARPTAAVAYPTFGRPPSGSPTVVVTLGGHGGATATLVRSSG